MRLKIKDLKLRIYWVKNHFILTEKSSLHKFPIDGTYFNENIMGKQNCKHMRLNFCVIHIRIDNHPNVLKIWNIEGAVKYIKNYIIQI